MFENRLMNASQLADYVGVPRSTMDPEELERSAESSERARQGSNQYPLPCQGSPEHEFSRKIKAKRPVDVQTEKEQDRNETLFAVDLLLTGSAAVEVGLYANFPGGVAVIFGARAVMRESVLTQASEISDRAANQETAVR